MLGIEPRVGYNSSDIKRGRNHKSVSDNDVILVEGNIVLKYFIVQNCMHREIKPYSVKVENIKYKNA